MARDLSASTPLRGPTALSRPSWLPGALLAAYAVLITLTITYPHGPGQRVILAWALCLPILALRRWPLPVLAAATAANALVMAGGLAPLPFGIMLGLASYLAASRLPRRLSIPAAAASAAALGGALVYAVFTATREPLAATAVEGFLPLVAAWFTGDSVAARRRYQAGLAEQAQKEQAAEAERARQQVREERVRIARELHDVVAHTLAVITVQAGVGRRLMAKRPEEAATALESIENIGRTAQDELRVVLGLLRDDENRTAVLSPAPRLVDVKELVETVRASGTPVDLHVSGTDRSLSPALELSVYRVIQEALTNVVKHAPGARAAVSLAVSDYEILLDITNDAAPPSLSPLPPPLPAPLPRTLRAEPPAPFPAPLPAPFPAEPPAEPPATFPATFPAPLHAPLPAAGEWQAGPGHGIVGMRERIAAFGGWLVAEPLADRGFRVNAQVPIEGAP